MIARTYGSQPILYTQPRQIVFLIGEHLRLRLTNLLGAYLNTDQVERVVLITRSSAAAAEIAAPYAAFRENGRLATLIVLDDLAHTLTAARRGWGHPDIIIGSLNDNWGATFPARPNLTLAGEPLR
ncbi:MAG: hypothetical protein HC822_16390 [Oscillochloris sp.]|nr:hypothetical protein [Oscillochloris sp.]